MDVSISEEQSKILWEQLLADADSIAPLPESAYLVIQEIGNPNSTPDSLQKIIRNDPALTAKVLKMANSAFYGFPKKIESLSKAIIILGHNTLKTIVFAALAYSSLSHAITSYGMEAEVLYRTGLATAIASGLLCKQLGIVDHDRAFVASILHDLGKLLLANIAQPYMGLIHSYSSEKEISFDQAERHVLGFNQNDAGGLLAKQWGLPLFIEDCCRYYHEPSLCESMNRSLVELVHMADVMMQRLKLCQGIDFGLYIVHEELFLRHNLDEKRQLSLVKELESTYLELYSALVNG